MNTLQRVGIGAAALLLMVGLLAPRSAEASHFRGMYVYVSDVLPGNKVEITVVQFWRYSAFGNDFSFDDPGQPEVGDEIDPTTSFFLDLDAAVDLGDGTTYGDESSETWTLTGLDDSEDWAVIQATFTHTYPSSGEYTVGLSGFARIDDLENGWNNEDYVVESDIRTDNVSATTSSGPFVGVPQGTNVTYQVPFTNPDNDQLRFKLADPSDAGVSGGTNPPNLSIDEQTGEITWDNSSLSQGSLHALQVTIEEYDPGVDPENSPPKATVASDFIFRVASQGNEQPVCELDPASTTVSPGTPVNIDVTGSDAVGDADDNDGDGNTVRISSTSLPGGNLNPNPLVGTSPQTATFSWTPSSVGTFNAQFSVGDGLTTTLCTATINVEPQQTCDTPTLAADDIDKQNGTLSNTISDDDGVEEFTFTTLDGFKVISSFDSGFDKNSKGLDEGGVSWTWTGSGDPPTSVPFELGATETTATYFLEVTDACDDPGPNTTTFDPAYEFGPVATQARLAGNAPNPFSGRTTVEFTLPEQTRVTVSVYDMMGRKVATLVDGVRSSGPHTVSWNGRADGGQDLASGVYLLRMQAGGQTFTQRVTVVR